VRPFGHGTLAGLQNFSRRIGVGKSLGEIDRIVLVRDAGHFADYGFSEIF
jgi:hypothetical protein